MANPEHLAILNQGVNAWNTWRLRNLYIMPDLIEVQLGEANLNGANLNGANLNGANLSGASLNGASLRGANLNGANLSGASLRGVDLTRALLNRAFLNKALLIRASLYEAGLGQASFISARLDECNFRRARMRGTILGSIDLSTAIGLDQVEHIGPSTIWIDTLYLSKGMIPEVFLRGAGVPDEIIALQSPLRGKPIEFYSVFISYSHADKSFARLLYERLQGRGIRCWLDEHQLLPGDPVYESIDRGIRLWDKVLLCCSESSLTSWWVDNELKAALEKEQKILKEENRRVWAVIPLDLDEYVFSKECKSSLSTQIKTRSVAKFKGWEHDNVLFEAQFERVLAALRTDDGGRGDPPASKL
jgi:hypothetical protein